MKSVSVGATLWGQYCLSRPGAGAPQWAAAGLYAEYLGSSTHEGEGAIAAGCTSLVYEPLTAHGQFVYTIGKFSRHQQPMSIGTDSKRFGAAIFIGTAAKPILRLIRHGEDIGGPPPVRVANGEVYAVTTRDGTVILARSEDHITGTTVESAYVELPPSAAAAWLTAMQRVGGAWLWPRVASRVKGTVVYRLSRLGFGPHYDGTIAYHLTSRRAVLIIGHKKALVAARGTQISDSDLQRLRSTAL